ncbi:hypothetical protein [Paracraurococcus lichenis]|uniref:Uncharacterized protein n=1 Tax=Paracraurococcus lichenis TaxID=3064888 RepID=A0ABT9ECE2_9PROT|nr:hypothetical protein [Paracraurococcus sp. LOR1-02]MDO9713886.1 hypothetical protein [Paracraurococcus sp. LOR1-02]
MTIHIDPETTALIASSVMLTTASLSSTTLAGFALIVAFAAMRGKRKA